MRVPVDACHSIGASWGVGGVVVTRVWRRGGGGPLGDAGKLNGPANYATDRRLTYKRREMEKIAKEVWMMTNIQTGFTSTTPEHEVSLRLTHKHSQYLSFHCCSASSGVALADGALRSFPPWGGASGPSSTVQSWTEAGRGGSPLLACHWAAGSRAHHFWARGGRHSKKHYY